MMRCPDRIAFLLPLLWATPGLTQDAAMLGAWCNNDQGGIVYIEADGIALNEHTVCQPGNTKTDGGRYQATLQCENVYFDGAETVRAFAISMDILVEQVSADSVNITFDDDPEPFLFNRCG